MKEKTIYALGFFDGVHLGHGALLNACQKKAQENNTYAGVVTFGDHPDTLVLGTTPGLINTPADRERLLRHFGMSTVVTLPFDEHMKTMPWQDFIQMLREEYNAAGFVCGEDFRFGNKGQGTAMLLEEFCRKNSLPCAVVPEQMAEGVRISSTYIRSLLESGQMGKAVKLLGHPYIFTGTVVHGIQLGRTLGIPTANLHLPEALAVPRFGVYACRCTIDGVVYPAVTNIGTRPTVNGQGITVEPWILDYCGDLYGREITLEFLEFLRPEVKFDCLESLKQEIHRNAEQTREILESSQLI